MKATVVHNPTAGRGSLSQEELLTAIREAGFHPSYHSTKAGEYKAALQDPGALVFAVGGDGTVVKVARELRDSNVALAIVPIGTANNIASSLGISGPPRETIPTAASGVATPVDLGLIRSGWGGRLFVEGTGFGLFPRVIASVTDWHRDLKGLFDTGEQELCRDIQHWLDTLAEVEGREYGVEVDGRDLTGTYLMVEVVNIPVLGPNLGFAEAANPFDGELDLVLVDIEDRLLVEAFLAERLRGGHPTWSRKVYRGKEMRLRWRDAVPHVDDSLWHPEETVRESGGENVMTVTCAPGAILVMVPRHDTSQAIPAHDRGRGGRIR